MGIKVPTKIITRFNIDLKKFTETRKVMLKFRETGKLKTGQHLRLIPTGYIFLPTNKTFAKNARQSRPGNC